ncbi:MAG: hypothetical protein HKN31_12955 [Pricia sp.]|nr:hypothetical protein [Pricia sp.]
MKARIKITCWLLSFLFIAGFSNACSKDSDVGPQGEQGEIGTANIIYSDWIPSGLEENPVFNNTSFKIESRLISEEIVQHGVILVFGKHIKDTDQFIFPLPITFNGRNTRYYYYSEEENNLKIVAASVDGMSDFQSNYLEEFRYVLIPGGMPAEIAFSSTDLNNFSKMSYEEIAERLSISD